MKDPSGRRYSLPYFLVKTWDGMQYLLEQAFLNVEGLGPRVAKGEYDLIDSDEAVIIPHLWETFIEPDMLLTMQMWPPPSQQTPPASTPVQAPPKARWTPARPPTPIPQRVSPPRPSISQPRFTVKQPPSVSQTSSHKSSNQKPSRKSGTSTWSLFWSSSPPPKARSTKSRHLSSRMSSRSDVSSDEDCNCSECRYPQTIWRSPPPPSPLPAPSSHASQFKARYGDGVVYATYSLQERPAESWKNTEMYKKFTITDERSTAERVTKVATPSTESISTVEPIFELDAEQIYELE